MRAALLLNPELGCQPEDAKGDFSSGIMAQIRPRDIWRESGALRAKTGNYERHQLPNRIAGGEVANVDCQCIVRIMAIDPPDSWMSPQGGRQISQTIFVVGSRNGDADVSHAVAYASAPRGISIRAVPQFGELFIYFAKSG
jgi:hypothetical protein